MNRFAKLILVSLLLGVLFGCAINQPIRYKTLDIPPSNSTQLKGITLSVELFADNRSSVSENRIVFIDGRETKIGEKRVCINSEEHYNKEPVAKQITMAVSEHLKQRGAFKDVLVDSKASADFQIQGAIRQFYGQQDFSYSAAIGSGFGLIGALVTMGATTPGVIKIELTDLKLVDKSGVQVKELKDINKSFEGELPADAYCWQIFWNANLKLKEAVDVLSEDVEKNISENMSSKLDEPMK